MNLLPDIFTPNLISSLIGTMVGAIISYLFALRQFRIKEAVETERRREDTGLQFYVEQTSSEYTRAKSETRKIFEEHVAAISIDDFYSTLPEDKKDNIRKVLSFYRRLHVVIKYNRIDNEIVTDFLSGEFLWWYFTWLDKLIPASWETRPHIDGINNCLQRKMVKQNYEQAKASTSATRGAAVRSDPEKTSN